MDNAVYIFVFLFLLSSFMHFLLLRGARWCPQFVAAGFGFDRKFDRYQHFFFAASYSFSCESLFFTVNLCFVWPDFAWPYLALLALFRRLLRRSRRSPGLSLKTRGPLSDRPDARRRQKKTQSRQCRYPSGRPRCFWQAPQWLLQESKWLW